ncbi:hypothetical protein M758_10G177000 [Ceratodon purpureus]|nr:hypothetical protein M758_10G177000 [Ceratodon purpureus]
MDALDKRVVDELEEVGARYFTVKIQSKTHPGTLDIPPAFAEKHRWHGNRNCTLVTVGRSQVEWPLEFSIVRATGRARTALSVGHGWTSFLENQKVTQGSLLVFEFVDPSCLVVSMYHPDRPRELVVEGEQSDRSKPLRPDLEESDVDDLEDVRDLYFTLKMLTKTHRRTLDIPPAFTEKTGWPQKPDCTLVMSSNAQKEWPILFSIVQASGGARTASSVGHGWTSFLQDQEVGQGSLLIFEFVDATSLAVTIYHPDRPRKIEDVGEEQSNRRKAHGPVFQKTLKASHVRQGHASRLDFPIAYWREYGADHFKDTYFTLSGPSRAVRVKSCVYVNPKQTFVYLSKGWSDFVAMNDFKVGDTLTFAAVGTQEFNVDRRSE